MDWFRKYPNRKKHLFIQEVLMQLLNYMDTGLRLITAKPIICLPAMAFCLIMNPRSAAKPLLPVRLPVLLPELPWDLQDKLFLGNLSSKRDWGHAKDYIRAMYLILQQDKPEDFVIATGITTEIREFVRMAFAEIGIEIEFKGSGVDEKGYIKTCSDQQVPGCRGKRSSGH